MTGRGITYYTQPYKGFKDQIKKIITDRWSGPPISHEVGVSIVCWVQQPKKTKLPSPRPDVDNYAKAVLDGMNKIVLEDDTLVKKLIVEKFWAAPGEPGRIHVHIEEV